MLYLGHDAVERQSVPWRRKITSMVSFLRIISRPLSLSFSLAFSLALSLSMECELNSLRAKIFKSLVLENWWILHVSTSSRRWGVTRKRVGQVILRILRNSESWAQNLSSHRTLYYLQDAVNRQPNCRVIWFVEKTIAREQSWKHDTGVLSKKRNRAFAGLNRGNYIGLDVSYAHSNVLDDEIDFEFAQLLDIKKTLIFKFVWKNGHPHWTM